MLDLAPAINEPIVDCADDAISRRIFASFCFAQA